MLRALEIRKGLTTKIKKKKKLAKRARAPEQNALA
jgi:hypothetical protein